MVPTADRPAGNARQLADIEQAVVLGRGKARRDSSLLKPLSRPFWASMLLSVAGLLALGFLLVHTLDRHALSQSEQIFQAVLDDNRHRLSNLALTYASRNNASVRLVANLDADWLKTNLVRVGQGITGVHILDQNNGDRLHFFNGAVSDGSVMSIYGRDAFTIINEARRAPSDKAPVPIVAFFGDARNLFLGAAVRIASDDSANQTTGANHVLMLVEALDLSALTALSAKYQLPNLQISRTSPASLQASYPIKSVDGRTMAWFVWEPSLPGQGLIAPLAIGLMFVFIVMALSARAVMSHASHLVDSLDIAQKRTERAKVQLAYQARTDALTGLGNRRHFETSVQTLAASANGRTEFALLSLDLDRFKTINDTMGHEAGDEVLVQVAAILSELVYPQDKIFRLGSDEFVILFGSTDKDHIMSVCRDAMDQLSKPMQINGIACQVRASAGIAYATDPNHLLHKAEAALSQAKRSDCSQALVYKPEHTVPSSFRTMAG